MATITRTTTFQDCTTDLIAVEGYGASRKDRVKKVSVTSAGHPYYNSKSQGKGAANGRVNTSLSGDLRITDLAGTDWYSVTTRNQSGKRTFYLAPDTRVVGIVEGVAVNMTLADLYNRLDLAERLHRFLVG